MSTEQGSSDDTIWVSQEYADNVDKLPLLSRAKARVALRDGIMKVRKEASS